MEHIGTYTSFVCDTSVINAKGTEVRVRQLTGVLWNSDTFLNVWKRFVSIDDVNQITCDTFSIKL